jgi:hypothetical protein
MRGRLAAVLAVAALLVSAADVAAITRLPGFRTPTKNISCFFVLPHRDDAGKLLPGNLLCSIAHASYAAKLQSVCAAGSGVDWHGWTLASTRRGAVSCSGGILYDPGRFRPGYVTLGYGQKMIRIGITCVSAARGVTCTNTHGHGLFISRTSWRVW